MSEGQQKIRGHGRFWVEEEELTILKNVVYIMNIFIYIFYSFYYWCTAERVTHQRVFQQNTVFADAQMSAVAVGKLLYLLTYLQPIK